MHNPLWVLLYNNIDQLQQEQEKPIPRINVTIGLQTEHVNLLVEQKNTLF